jgi:predicted small metal-binding protein
MKRALVMLAAAVFFAFPGDARADSNAEMMEKAVQILERVASIVQMNQDDCNTMGDKLSKVVDENAAFLAQAKSRADAMPSAERTALENRYRGRILAAIGKMKPGMDKCGANPKVQGALSRINR